MKWTFRQARHAESLLQAIFPDKVSALLRWGTVRVEESGDVDAALSARHRDLMLSIRLRHRPGRLGVLIEQQRKVERRMMLRAGDYLGRTWQKLAAGRKQGRLPPLVAIILYNGERPWTAPTAFQDLIELPGPPPGGAPASRRALRSEDLLPEAEPHPGTVWLAEHTPHFKVHLLDLHGGQMDGIHESALTPLARVVLSCLSVAGNDELLEECLGRIAGSLSEILEEPDGADAFEALLRYLIATHPRIPAESIRVMVERVSGPRAQEVIVDYFDEIRNEARREGRAEAREALARTLLQGMVRRFGPVSEEVKERVRAASDQELRRWVLRLLDAATPEEVTRRSKLALRKNGARVPRRPAARSASHA